MVLFGHALMEAHESAVLSPSVYQRWNSFPWGAGVDLFFIISGFVMGYVSVKIPASWAGVRTFFVNRCIRIIPTYWFFTTAMLAAIFLFPSAVNHATLSAGHVIASLFFIPWEHPDKSGAIIPVLGQGWTLNYEVFFYLLVALSLFASGIKRSVLLTGMLALSWASGWVLRDTAHIFAFYGHTILLEFILGLWLYHGFRWRKALPEPLCLALVAAGIALLWLWNGQAGAGEEARALYRGIPALFIAAGLVFSSKIHTARGLPAKGAGLLGDASYSLYLSHPFILVPSAYFASTFEGVPVAIFVAVQCIVCLAASIALYLVLEKNLIRLCRALFDVRSSRRH